MAGSALPSTPGVGLAVLGGTFSKTAFTPGPRGGVLIPPAAVPALPLSLSLVTSRATSKEDQGFCLLSIGSCQDGVLFTFNPSTGGKPLLSESTADEFVFPWMCDDLIWDHHVFVLSGWRTRWFLNGELVVDDGRGFEELDLVPLVLGNDLTLQRGDSSCSVQFQNLSLYAVELTLADVEQLGVLAAAELSTRQLAERGQSVAPRDPELAVKIPWFPAPRPHFQAATSPLGSPRPAMQQDLRSEAEWLRSATHFPCLRPETPPPSPRLLEPAARAFGQLAARQLREAAPHLMEKDMPKRNTSTTSRLAEPSSVLIPLSDVSGATVTGEGTAETSRPSLLSERLQAHNQLVGGSKALRPRQQTLTEGSPKGPTGLAQKRPARSTGIALPSSHAASSIGLKPLSPNEPKPAAPLPGPYLRRACSATNLTPESQALDSSSYLPQGRPAGSSRERWATPPPKGTAAPEAFTPPPGPAPSQPSTPSRATTANWGRPLSHAQTAPST